MRVARSEHRRHTWWVDDYARDFELLDVWRYPIEAGRDDFAAFLEIHDTEAMVAESSPAVRALFGLRIVLGRVFGWDKPGSEGEVGGEHQGVGAEAFREVYRDEREMVQRIENATVTALMHLGWVPLDAAGSRWTAQLAVFVDPKGRLGRVYMAAIAPFRHHLVYPALMRAGRRRWQARDGS
ncbi:MAG: DUF2867 domain-containing protein [Acidobacteriota bacterium]